MRRTKRLGLVGGISWVSTEQYYRIINEGVNQKLGGIHAARLIVDSIDFHDFVTANAEGRWDLTLGLMRGACQNLARAGAEGIMLCANTAHAVIEHLKAEFDLPFIDIIEQTSAAISRVGLRRVALIGTQFTMELPFYKDRLAKDGIEAVVPDLQSERDFIQETIRNELGCGHVLSSTRKAYLDIIRSMINDGCQGVIFGCTEIPLLLKQEDFSVPCFDTTKIHASAGVEFLLGGGGLA